MMPEWIRSRNDHGAKSSRLTKAFRPDARLGAGRGFPAGWTGRRRPDPAGSG
jgi:hypothetical protein